MAAQFAPVASQRTHWYANARVAGVLSHALFVDAGVDSTCPSVALPEIAGTTELRGAITAVAPESAEPVIAEPPLEAVVVAFNV